MDEVILNVSQSLSQPQNQSHPQHRLLRDMHWIKRFGNEKIVAIVLMDLLPTQKLIISSGSILKL